VHTDPAISETPETTPALDTVAIAPLAVEKVGAAIVVAFPY